MKQRASLQAFSLIVIKVTGCFDSKKASSKLTEGTLSFGGSTYEEILSNKYAAKGGMHLRSRHCFPGGLLIDALGSALPIQASGRFT